MTTVSIVQSEEVFHGRWGFYPCAVEAYRKLRRLNLLRFRSAVAEAAWNRWNRKMPHNRIARQTVRDGSGRPIRREPKLDDLGQQIPIPEPRRPIAAAYVKAGGKNFAVHISKLIEADYRAARYPKASEGEVARLSLTPAQVDEQLARYEGWYAA
jgi:hypothetical protein